MDIQRTFPIQWYAVGWSNEVTKRPIRKAFLGKDVTLYRTEEGRIGAIHSFCTHRGAALSLGKVENNCMVCPYHGWKFNADGECIHIPSQPSKTIPVFAHSYSYPVQERAGLIWVYPVSNREMEKVPDLVLPSRLEDKKYRLAPYDAVWNAHFTRVVESVLDVAHLAFVHKKTIGKYSKEEIEELDFTQEGDTIHIRSGQAYITYTYPQHWMQVIGTDGKMINYLTFTPIGEEETRIYGLTGRVFAKWVPLMDTIFAKYSSKILEEDRGVVESQHPRPIPEALRLEAHVAADAAQVRFRQRWFELLNGHEPKITL